MTQREWAMSVAAPLIFARAYGTHPRVLAKMGIPEAEWPVVWQRFGRRP